MWKLNGTVVIDNRSYYKVQCECGYEGTRRIDHVDSGRSKMCKSCSAKETVKSNSNGFFCKRAHSGVVDFSITIEDAWKQYLQQDGKCALSGVKLSLSETQINGNPDYTLTDEEFKDWCRKVCEA